VNPQTDRGFTAKDLHIRIFLHAYAGLLSALVQSSGRFFPDGPSAHGEQRPM
jgi:hypothetical protein